MANNISVTKIYFYANYELKIFPSWNKVNFLLLLKGNT